MGVKLPLPCSNVSAVPIPVLNSAQARTVQVQIMLPIVILPVLISVAYQEGTVGIICPGCKQKGTTEVIS